MLTLISLTIRFYLSILNTAPDDVLYIGNGKLLFAVHANETDIRQVRRHVQEIVNLVGAEHLRMDELSVYDGASEGIEHTICLAHWLKSKSGFA